MLRIATFNIENLGEADTATLEDRFTILRSIIERIDGDILCLQEINAQKKERTRDISVLKELLQGTRYENYEIAYSKGITNLRLSDRHNLVILSRFPILSSKQYLHDLIEGPTYKTVSAFPTKEKPEKIEWERPFLLCEVELPNGQSLYIINLHLKAPLASLVEGQKHEQQWQSIKGWAEGYFMAALKRDGQALEARFVIDQILSKDKEAKIIVCGDFNSQEHEVPMRILTASEMDTGSSRLAPYALIPAEHSIPENRRFTILHHGRPQMLDHILMSRGLYANYHSCEVHNEAIGDELIEYDEQGQTPGSSHAPLIAQFKL